MQPLVSVIIPCYNAEKYVGETIQSILDQTYPSVEVIVVNDGSTDNSEKIINSFNNTPITYLTQKNAGASTARNYGASHAKGKYLIFIDSDDKMLPENITMKVNFLENHKNLEVVLSDSWLWEYTTGKQEYLNSRVDDSTKRLLEFLPMDAGIHSCMLTKNIFDKIGGFDTEILNPSEDREFFIRLSLQTKFGHIPLPLVQYRQHANQIHKNVEKLEKSILRTFHKHHKLGTFRSEKYYKYCMSKLYLMLSGSFWHHTGSKQKTVLYFFKSAVTNTSPLQEKIMNRFRNIH